MRTLLTLALLVSATAAHADVIVAPSNAITGMAGAAGLTGTYYHEGAGATGFSLAKTIALADSSTATGSFVSTAINYRGTDSSSITSFLANDQASYKGTTPGSYDLSDAILSLKGYFFVPRAETIQFSLNGDDAAQFSIGNQIVVSNNYGSESANATFTAPGYYAVSLIYGNTNYYNVGNAALNLSANGVTVSGSNIAQSVAQNVVEPSSIALLGLAVVGFAVVSRRRQQQSVSI